jgi:hypothetical protein
VKKQNGLFMTAEDERAFSELLRADFPDVLMLDDNVWESPSPPGFESIHQCTSSHVYLWNKAIFPELRGQRRKDGKWQGPASGIVIQFSRCRFQHNLLISGRLAVGLNDGTGHFEAMKAFVQTVWSIAARYCTKALVAVDPDSRDIINPNVRSYFIGPSARSWCISSESRLFKDRGTINFYLPA